jgi:hypothetical protein
MVNGAEFTSHPVAQALRDLLRERDEARARAAAAYEDAANACDPTSYRAHHASTRRRCQKAILERASDPERDALAERDARIRAEAYRDGWVNGSNGVAPPDFPDATFIAQEDR